MRVRLLTSYASASESRSYGDLIELRDDVARAWIKEGLCERVSQDEATADDVARLTARNAELESAATDLAARERAAVSLAEERRAQIAALETASGDAPALAKENASLRDKLTFAEKQAEERLAAMGSTSQERALREDAERRVNELTAEVARLEAIAAGVDGLEAEIKELRERVADLTSENATLQDTARADQALIESLTSKIDANTSAMEGSKA